MDGEINPLVKLLYGEDKSQFRIYRLQDHLARIEMKVQQLESRVPYCLEQSLLVGAAEVDDDDYDTDDEDDKSRKKGSNKQPSSNKGSKEKGKDQRGSHQKTKEQKRRKKEDENNCFARLLFSKCWSGSNQGKNSKAGWNLKNCCYKTGRVKKGACPAYSTCPCGEDAPCAKIDKKPCPANQKKSGGAGSGGGGSGGGGSGGKGKKKEGGEGSKNRKSDKMKTDENPLSALCGKLCNGPCIFSRKGGENGEGKSSGWCGSCNRKKHVHTPCCCRCKDNPDLAEKEKSKQSSKSESKQSNKKGSAPPQKKPKESNVSFDDDDISVHSAIIFQNKDGKDPTQEPMRCVGCTDCDDIRRGSRKGTIRMVMSEENMKLIEDKKKQRGETKTTEENIEVLSKSSTNFQLLLPPTISTESSDHNMVSHQILKTLSTIHGPIRVEQKIVVKGTKNAFVIVTHGEACECNICSTLKKDGIPDRTSNDNPKVVRFPTDNGCDTLVNHSDNCQCTLCSVLEQGITEETPNAGMDKCPSSGAWASWSRNDLRTTIDQNSDSVVQDPHSKTEVQNDRATPKKHSRKNKEEYRRKKCHCLNCVKRRKDKRLKKRLKHVLEPSDISQVLMELSHHGFTFEPTPSLNEDDDDDEGAEDTSKVSSASSKRVSFSSDTKVRRYGDTKSSGNSDSKETVVPSRNGKGQLTQTTKTDGSDRKRKSKGSKGAKPSSHRKDDPEQFNIMQTSPCKHYKIPSKPCGCIICKYSDVTPRGATLSKMVHHRPGKDEEQKCFPEKAEVPSNCGCKKDTCTDESDQLRGKMLDEIIYPDDDFIRPPTRCEPGCKGRCRYLTPRDELNDIGKDQTVPVVVQASREGLPPKVLYWIPSSPNLAAAFSSESYYIPDLDEFPAGRDQSNTHSSKQNSTNSKPEPGSSYDIRSRTAKVKRSHGSS